MITGKHESENEDMSATGKQSVRQGESSKTGGQGLKVEQDSNCEQDKYTRPPRVSFGVELEFLVHRRTSGDDDESVAGLPPVLRSDDWTSSQESVARMLREHGLDAYSTTSPDADRSGPLKWVVANDGSVSEYGEPSDRFGVDWDNLELISPPLYACDEAFRLVAAVIRLVTTNFRVRVNHTCGLHVHVGNGPHHLDMRAMRNYAALLWATDNILSTLHCPSRSATKYSNSNRRIAYTDLSSGVDAKQAYGVAICVSSWIPRFLGRTRKLGEAPVVSRQKFRKHIEDMENARPDPQHDLGLDPKCPSDDSDWEMPNSKPFFRPKKRDPDVQRQTRKIPTRDFLLSPEEEARLDSESITRELPPQVDFDMAGLGLPPFPPPGSTPKPFLETDRPRQKQLDIEEIKKDDKIAGRYEPTRYPAADSWKLTWPGVKELLSCDVGVHQVATLMSRSEGQHRYASSNWVANTPEAMTPGDMRSKGGRRTIECRLAGGSMDADWVVTWIKIQCRLLEWARDAEPSVFMGVLCKLARDDDSPDCTYDVLDLLRDLGMYTSVKICEERLKRAEEAWYQCMLIKDYTGSSQDTSINTDMEISFNVGNQDFEGMEDVN
ncbi:hypothetical protein N0V84_011868 [Fusarium piperis]|uniref:Ig-like domain-containing protein n=1 Tax=Fusarium piperis TaxID=1435070 RepID=A0A9W8W362_9HYPO|nr:hypothetical protein N0V84_011868 [Fusarium piperis]